jgi:hypothetical protein
MVLIYVGPFYMGGSSASDPARHAAQVALDIKEE